MSSLIHKLTVKCTQGATLVERRREKATNLESHRDYPLDEITTLTGPCLDVCELTYRTLCKFPKFPHISRLQEFSLALIWTFP